MLRNRRDLFQDLHFFLSIEINSEYAPLQRLLFKLVIRVKKKYGMQTCRAGESQVF
jgi:hypothetical protein